MQAYASPEDYEAFPSPEDYGGKSKDKPVPKNEDVERVRRYSHIFLSTRIACMVYLFIYLFSFVTQRNYKNDRKERKKERKKKRNVLKD